MHTHTANKTVSLIRPTTQHLFPFINLPFIGIDEAGRGCLAGPVVAAAVWLPHPIPNVLYTLDDSKKLTVQQRERMAPLIKEHALAFGVGFSWSAEIDRVNILNATFISMSRACAALYAQYQKRMHKPNNTQLYSQPLTNIFSLPLAIDGNHSIPLPYWVPSYPLPQQVACIGGDTYTPAISAASILAKTIRDTLMLNFAKRFSSYHFASHKGYATQKHIQAIQKHGPCALHRLTFKKVRPEPEQVPLFSPSKNR